METKREKHSFALHALISGRKLRFGKRESMTKMQRSVGVWKGENHEEFIGIGLRGAWLSGIGLKGMIIGPSCLSGLLNLQKTITTRLKKKRERW